MIYDIYCYILYIYIRKLYVIIYTYGCFLKWWYPQNSPHWSFLVGKPVVVGYHHFRKPPYIHMWYAMLRFLWQTLWFYDSLSNWLLAWKQMSLVNWGQRCRCELPGPRGWWGWTDQHTYRDSPGLTEFLAVSYNLYVFKCHFMGPRKASCRAGNIFNFITPTAGGPEHVAPGDYFGAEHLWQHYHCLVGLGRIGFTVGQGFYFPQLE